MAELSFDRVKLCKMIKCLNVADFFLQFVLIFGHLLGVKTFMQLLIYVDLSVK